MEKDFTKVNSMVVFDRPLRLPYMNLTIYGFVFDSSWDERDAITEFVQTYVEYLVGLCRWNTEGGTISDNADIWYDKDGQAYQFNANDEFFINYRQDAYALNSINYQIKWGCCPHFESEDLVEAFIIKNVIRGIWKK